MFIFLAGLAFLFVWWLVAVLTDMPILALFFAVMAAVCVIILGNGSSYCIIEAPLCRASVEQNEARERAEEADRQRECNTPVLVSEIDGIRLYKKIGCHGERDVFFSASGTHTTHTERHGKSTTTYDDDVFNSEVKK